MISILGMLASKPVKNKEEQTQQNQPLAPLPELKELIEKDPKALKKKSKTSSSKNNCLRVEFFSKTFKVHHSPRKHAISKEIHFSSASKFIKEFDDLYNEYKSTHGIAPVGLSISYAHQNQKKTDRQILDAYQKKADKQALDALRQKSIPKAIVDRLTTKPHTSWELFKKFFSDFFGTSSKPEYTFSSVTTPRHFFSPSQIKKINAVKEAHPEKFSQAINKQRRSAWGWQGTFASISNALEYLPSAAQLASRQLVPILTSLGKASMCLVGGYLIAYLLSVSRELYLNKAKSYYPTAKEVGGIENPSEQAAFKAGTEGISWKNFLGSFFKKESMRHPLIYSAGLTLKTLESPALKGAHEWNKSKKRNKL